MWLNRVSPSRVHGCYVQRCGTPYRVVPREARVVVNSVHRAQTAFTLTGLCASAFDDSHDFPFVVFLLRCCRR